ncbi:DUF6518 family protein [Clostridium beijerinckii]|uniref:DUF6518 family protein n=1 Tax=Clostridium beijerinckii TaxID=1520 RepID=UPI001F4C4A25|nr:DUF6518 family protein [Clostridium beijerinckii]
MKINIYLHYLLSLLLGTIIGILTIFGQGQLKGNWNSLANLGTVWLVPAFFISSIANKKRSSITSCSLCLIGEVMGYYYFHSLLNKYNFSVDYFTLIWLGCAIAGGIIFGLAGYLWYHKDEKFHELGSALLSGVFLTDGLNMFIHIDDYRHMITVAIAEIVFGLLLIIILEKNMHERLRCCIFLIPVTILGLIGYTILYYLTI